MVDAGVPRDIAVSLIKWREAGKIFRIKEDVALCYDMTDSLYFTLEPYITIGEEYRIKPSDKPEQHYPTTQEQQIEYTSFRIDTASAEYLRTLGFSVRQADLVIRYRDMIGGYRNMAEFEECYAVDSAMASRLRPYIIFEPRDTTSISEHSHYEELKLPIDINSADSATLVRLNGIGPKSAVDIIRYRELLGGYYSNSQISELEVVTEENFHKILPQIWCDSAKIKKIFINFARSKELEVHPYVSNQMLKRIVNYRELKGGWSTIEEMIESNILTDEQAARIAPYLDFGTSPE
jgi:DNA uptake protein ComE-like DNA-binding protein